VKGKKVQKAIGFFRNFPLEKCLCRQLRGEINILPLPNRLVSSSPKRLTTGEFFMNEMGLQEELLNAIEKEPVIWSKSIGLSRSSLSAFRNIFPSG